MNFIQNYQEIWMFLIWLCFRANFEPLDDEEVIEEGEEYEEQEEQEEENEYEQEDQEQEGDDELKTDTDMEIALDEDEGETGGFAQSDPENSHYEDEHEST